MSVIATCYVRGVSTRRVEGIAKDLGVAQLSKSEVSALVKHLDGQLDAWRNRPLDNGPYVFVRGGRRDGPLQRQALGRDATRHAGLVRVVQPAAHAGQAHRRDHEQLLQRSTAPLRGRGPVRDRRGPYTPCQLSDAEPVWQSIGKEAGRRGPDTVLHHDRPPYDTHPRGTRWSEAS